MAGFLKFERISARIHPSQKEKLKKSGYNAREAIEYFNSISNKKIDSLKIDEYFLNKEIEELKEQLILKERRLESIQKVINDMHVDRLSSLRVDSYQEIIDLYNRNNTKKSFEDFIGGQYIRDKFISLEVDKFPDCDMDTFCNDLLDYYEDVILIGRTS